MAWTQVHEPKEHELVLDELNYHNPLIRLLLFESVFCTSSYSKEILSVQEFPPTSTKITTVALTTTFEISCYLSPSVKMLGKLPDNK